MKDSEIQANYARATWEVLRLCRDGMNIQAACDKVIADPAFPLGLAQIAQLNREAPEMVPYYLGSAA